MRPMIGVALGAAAVRAVAVQGRTVRWALEVTCTPEDDLATVLTELLGRAPLRRWPKPRVAIAVDARHAQVKRLVGLPPVTDPESLAALVREGVSRFFLKNGVPLVTSGVRVVEPGIAWAAAVDAPLVTELERACRAANVVLRTIVPTAVVLSTALEPTGETIQWHEGETSLLLTFRDGQMTALRRLPAHALHADGQRGDHDASGGDTGIAAGADLPITQCANRGQPVKPLVTLGADAWRFADAYGASQVTHAESLALRPGRDHASSMPQPRWRRTLAECACMLVVAAAVLAPGIAATHTSRVAAAQLAALGAKRSEALSSARDLGRVTAALDQVSAFERDRISATLLLHTLTAALPQGSALVTVRIDSTAGTLVALAPRAGAVVTALEHADGIIAPEIIGPVTREAVGSGELERVTIRFRIDPRARETVRAGQDAPEQRSSRTRRPAAGPHSSGGGA